MRFALHPIPPGMLDELLGVARRAGVTLNDLFLAAIADVCDQFNPIRHIPRRKDLALGMIVDLRARSRRDMTRVFGLFLGFRQRDLPPRRPARLAAARAADRAADAHPQADRFAASQRRLDVRRPGRGAIRADPQDVSLLPQAHAARRRHQQRQPEPHLGREVSPRHQSSNTSASPPPARWFRWSSRRPRSART